MITDSHLLSTPKPHMHHQFHSPVPVGVPRPLWWQAAQERKSRRRVRAPATVARSLCSGSLFLTHRLPPLAPAVAWKPSQSQQVSLLVVLPDVCLSNILAGPGFIQQAPSPPLCLRELTNWPLSNIKPWQTYDHVHPAETLARLLPGTGHWACCLLGI